jgi:citrate lyase synthetase
MKTEILNFLEREWQNEMIRRDTRLSNWKSPYEIKSYLDWLKQQKNVQFFKVIDRNSGEIVSAGSLLDGSIKDIIVKFSERGKGYGKRLVEIILKDVKSRPLFLQAMPTYRKFYEKLGFNVYGYDKSTGSLFMKIEN